jgi:hypothetical protein
LAEFGVVAQPSILIISALCFVFLALLGRKLPPSYRFLFAMASACVLSFHGYLHDLSLLLLPFLILSDVFVERADYLGLAFLGIIIALPFATIWIGSIMALWICSLIPVLLMLLLRFNGHAIEGRTPRAA